MVDLDWTRLAWSLPIFFEARHFSILASTFLYFEAFLVSEAVLEWSEKSAVDRHLGALYSTLSSEALYSIMTWYCPRVQEVLKLHFQKHKNNPTSGEPCTTSWFIKIRYEATEARKQLIPSYKGVLTWNYWIQGSIWLWRRLQLRQYFAEPVDFVFAWGGKNYSSALTHSFFTTN